MELRSCMAYIYAKAYIVGVGVGRIGVGGVLKVARHYISCLFVQITMLLIISSFSAVLSSSCNKTIYERMLAVCNMH